MLCKQTVMDKKYCIASSSAFRNTRINWENSIKIQQKYELYHREHESELGFRNKVKLTETKCENIIAYMGGTNGRSGNAYADRDTGN